jgi:hypothetical protein
MSDARVGLETGPLAVWLWNELREHDLPVICLDARHPTSRERCSPNGRACLSPNAVRHGFSTYPSVLPPGQYLRLPTTAKIPGGSRLLKSVGPMCTWSTAFSK